MLTAPLAAFVALAALALQGCGNQPAPVLVTPTSWPLQSADFVKYPTYQGALTVTGIVSIGEVDAGVQSIMVSLLGVDELCTGSQTGVGNVCGMHIHEGETCSTGTGGHYYVGESDPWIPVTYTFVDSPTYVAGIAVNTGYSLDELRGRAFVVHDSSGARVACALLQPFGGSSLAKVENFVKYPGSDTTLTVAGKVDVAVVGGGGDQQLVLRFALTGADPDCTPEAEITMSNGCGIHIHSGTSCESAGGVGGHWFESPVVADPWVEITYRNEVSSGVTYPVRIGTDYLGSVGRVVVVHDKTGARVACGVTEAVQQISAAARVDEAPDKSPWVWWVSATLVIAALGGGAWYYQSQRRGYATQQDDSTEMQTAPAQQDDSAEMKNAAAQQDDSTELHNAA